MREKAATHPNAVVAVCASPARSIATGKLAERKVVVGFLR